ncbi:MAG TPA: metallophosphoesterase [Trebonia sp.]|nr:metallophosphoesterase [Trebonia sp.]
MTVIRYVILSDLHFGAENSVLTALNERPATPGDTGFSADPQRPSPLLSGLIDGLRALTRSQDRPPTLILAGDILDLALSRDEVCAMVFRLFAHLSFDGGRPAFDPHVHYVPGNHDHHEWEITREAQYVSYVCGQPADAPLAAPWHTTRLQYAEERPAASSALLTGLARSQAGGSGVEVEVSYPNLALRTSDGRRCLIVSHGHFTESIYSMMSGLRDILYPGQRQVLPSDINRLEEENFAWIDFLWSTLGRSGQVGTDMGLIYADLTSPSDLADLVSNLTAALVARGKGPRWLHPPEQWVLNAILGHVVTQVAATERGTPSVALSTAGQKGLLNYLEGPVRGQLRQEWGSVPEEVTFVYGHTHKPFVDRRPVAGFPAPVAIANTGGWVVDTAVPAPVQAGVAVLVSENLDTASLQFYRQDAGSGPVPVQLLAPPAGARPSAWHAELAARIDPTAAPWAQLAQSAAELVAQRHRLQAATVALRAAMRSSRSPRSPAPSALPPA